MSNFIISKNTFLSNLYNSNSYEEVITKIEKEKTDTDSVKDMGKYIPMAKLHLGIIEEIEFYINNKTLMSQRDINLNEWIEKIFTKFPSKK